MKLIVLADEILKAELLSNGIQANTEIHWIQTASEFSKFQDVDGYIDLLFDSSDERIKLLKQLSATVIINSVEKTLEFSDVRFIRINAWPTFLARTTIEASGHDNHQKLQAEFFFQALNKKIEWLPDEPGFVSARVVAMIINESWYALNEEVSAKTDIDIAMKLGTNYPFGPFEWCTKIGEEKIIALLNELGKKNPRYLPAKLSEKKALQ